ncbi:unnamed protein product [Victoria cruziana]
MLMEVGRGSRRLVGRAAHRDGVADGAEKEERELEGWKGSREQRVRGARVNSGERKGILGLESLDCETETTTAYYEFKDRAGGQSQALNPAVARKLQISKMRGTARQNQNLAPPASRRRWDRDELRGGGKDTCQYHANVLEKSVHRHLT